MTKVEAYKIFKRMYKGLFLAEADYWKAQLMWAGFTDCLCKSGQITQKQYSNWSTPFKYGKHLSRRAVA